MTVFIIVCVITGAICSIGMGYVLGSDKAAKHRTSVESRYVRYRVLLEELAYPMGWRLTSSRPIECFIDDRVKRDIQLQADVDALAHTIENWIENPACTCQIRTCDLPAFQRWREKQKVGI
jgi:hypothetical protein